ncbi:site-specific DNA-methyltransferase [Natrialba chahannaoensis JCM 10990]|uniref:Type II methyltransferase n=1 Tax=Natrialba chahannaoensis JCM 10990 TaxID=1227492 RepID=M0AEE8_9EURY|nr:site-specific DNA-methyltransferase [Natrialba chahannaoensis]ELY95713.1 site-specific DNA-methyltransferase [Natrialba chahannaoensis JCM 10990]
MVDLDGIDDLDVHWSTSEEMTEVKDGTVQSVITSPPYWDLKDYGHEDQIGTADKSYEHYHDRMETVWSQCYDVLRDDGTMWVVVDTVMERGNLQLLPYHIAERAEDVGFVLQDMVTWYKPTAIAGMTDRNVVNKKEYVIYLSKSKDHKFRDKEGQNGLEDPAVAEGHRLGNLWRHPVKRGTVGQNVLHKAPYPTSLINRIVEVSTEPGDTVLDPFFGSGTTAVSALELDRRCIGYELNEEFREVISERLASLQQCSLTEF